MADYSGPNLWDALPEECKSMILSRLSNREAARIARVSKEFDEVVKNIRDSVQLLVLPPDLSPTALEGFVASHRNLKSLSFKRCSAKVKRFLPILEAAAGGKLDSKWYHRRSLESVDFKSCAFLTDVDVNALCVLHSRLEDVNLANCSGISDVALTVLSRYQQSRPDSNEPSPVSSATTPSEKWPEVPAEEASSMPVIIRENPVTIWPELSVQPSKVTTGGCIWGARSAGPPQAAVDIGQSSKTTNPSPPSKSYAQAALKAVDNPSPMVLPHIDWTGVKIPAYTSNDKYPIPSEAPVAEEPNQGKFTLFSTRKKKGNKGKLALPERQSDDMRLPSSRRMDKVVVEDNGKGRRNCSLDFESSGDRRLATRMSLHIPDSQVSTSETEYRKLAEDPLQFSLLRNGKKALQRSQESTPLPAGLEGLQVGTMMKHGKHKDIAPELLEYQMETPIFCGRGDEDHWKVRGLRSVSLAGCNDITDKGVQALLRGPSKDSLVSLDISRCSSVTSAGLRLPPVSVLENLVAAQLPNISRLFLQLSSEGSLRHLSLAACPKLDDLHLVAPYLQTLNLSNCKKLIRLQLKCPELLSCNLSLCESLELIARFTCGSVQVVNVYGCRLLRPVGFSTILDSSVSLRELRCGGCDRLERLEIPQSSLVRLEAQGCSSLRRLYVQSRLLKSVDACGCKILTEVYLFSPNLRRMLFTNCTLLQTLVLPLDAMKQSVDLEVKNLDEDLSASREGLEISISGCNVSESVQKNLARLCKHWKSTFAT